MADGAVSSKAKIGVRLNFLPAKFGSGSTWVRVAHLVVVVLALAQNGELRRVPIIHDQGAVPASHGIGLVGVHMAGMSVFSCCNTRVKSLRGSRRREPIGG
jgi:hypothetical protein